MSDFLEVALGFPTVVFTVAVVVSVAYWLVTSLGLLDLDADADLDALDGVPLLDALGLASVPPAVALTFAAVFAWFASLVASLLLDGLEVAGVVSVVVGIGVGLGALVVGVLLASVAVRPLARFSRSGPPPGLADVVGRTCTIRTGHVDEHFGQAEVPDGTGATLLVEVRCSDEHGLRRGDEALIFGFDPETGRFDVTRAPTLH